VTQSVHRLTGFTPSASKASAQVCESDDDGHLCAGDLLRVDSLRSGHRHLCDRVHPRSMAHASDGAADSLARGWSGGKIKALWLCGRAVVRSCRRHDWPQRRKAL
jgi:hypothetical protein